MRAVETPDFLPLGSVVIVKGSTKKVMIIARAVAIPQEGSVRYYDYGGCLYPEGLLGDRVIYFNCEGVQKVVHEGYADEENELILETLKENLAYVQIEKGDPKPFDPSLQSQGR